MKLKRNTIITVTCVAFFLILLGYISIRNEIVTLKESTNASWAQVENQLQRRYDLIPNLVSTVKGYAKHEKEIFENIAAARSKLAGAGSVNDKVAASNQLETSLSRLLVVVENYPNLKANQNFIRLMDELAGSENRISVERRRFNTHVQQFNQKILLFPSSFVAQRMGETKLAYFQIEQKAASAPIVSFD